MCVLCRTFSHAHVVFEILSDVLIRFMVPHTPTPEWAVSCMELVLQYGDPALTNAVMELVAGTSASETEDKFKHEAAWAAIDHGFAKSPELRVAAKRHLGVAV